MKGANLQQGRQEVEFEENRGQGKRSSGVGGF